MEEAARVSSFVGCLLEFVAGGNQSVGIAFTPESEVANLRGMSLTRGTEPARTSCP